MKGRSRELGTSIRQWLVNIEAYDRSSSLSEDESAGIDCLLQLTPSCHWAAHPEVLNNLERLLRPLYDVLALTGAYKYPARSRVLRILLRGMHSRQASFWSWQTEDWVELIRHDKLVRQHTMAIAYLLCGFHQLHAIGRPFEQALFAAKVFGQAPVDDAVKRVREALVELGYRAKGVTDVREVLCEALLANRSPHLEDLNSDVLDKLRQGDAAKSIKMRIFMLSRALVSLGLIAQPMKPDNRLQRRVRGEDGLSASWLSWSKRWNQTSTLQPITRHGVYYSLLKTGRWLATTHPDIVSPAQWTRDLAAEYLAAVDRFHVGEHLSDDRKFRTLKTIGKPLAACAKENILRALRGFFRDCQEWGWIPCRFDPTRALRTPRSIRSYIGPDPRVIADDVWAKLLWAGLNLNSDDLPRTRSTQDLHYPLEMVRALVMVWLFGGLRADEIRRLRVGCVRWQREDATVAGTDAVLPQDAVCLLDIPVNKTGTAFTKAVDRVVGEAIIKWERKRPDQPLMVDQKTGGKVNFLFAYRWRLLGRTYLNDNLIPLLCRKAGVPMADARGTITSHRARSTIATQLYNAKEPMTLYELQQWLGHRSPSSTQHYTKITPTKLAKSYADAGYFERNMRTIRVLIDRDAILNGAAATGQPWEYFDLGHGYCTNSFFVTCAHRMACAKCDFYLPKNSSKGQMLEAKSNLQSMLQSIPLTDDERAAVEEDVEAMNRLCAKLMDVPTPGGPTPRELKTGTHCELPVLPACNGG